MKFYVELLYLASTELGFFIHHSQKYVTSAMIKSSTMITLHLFFFSSIPSFRFSPLFFPLFFVYFGHGNKKVEVRLGMKLVDHPFSAITSEPWRKNGHSSNSTSRREKPIVYNITLHQSIYTFTLSSACQYIPSNKAFESQELYSNPFSSFGQKKNMKGRKLPKFDR